MSPPGTFERVYLAIRRRLREGLYRPGDRLEPAQLSDELNASVTPIRDALHRLTGERLVEAPRQEGFRAPMLTETMLRHLYGWHLDLLLLAVVKKRVASEPDAEREALAALPIHEQQNRLFLALARSTGNPEHAAVLEGLSHRLEPVQRLEAAFLDGLETETEQIIAAVRAGDRKALRSALIRYQRRRLRIIPELMESLLAPSPS